MNLTIDLTEDCIRDGIGGPCSACPAVLAAEVAFADAEIETGVIETGGANIDVWTPDNTYLIYIAVAPDPLSRFIEEFDSESVVEPMEIQVEFEDIVAGEAKLRRNGWRGQVTK